MTIPASGSFTSENVRAEWGGSYPLSSNTVAGWLGFSGTWSTEALRGRSAQPLSISLSASQHVRVGGASSQTWRVYRTLTPSYSGFTPASYAWSSTSSAGRSSLTSTNGATSQISQSYDINEGEWPDGGTIYLTITDTNGQTHSTSVPWSI